MPGHHCPLHGGQFAIPLCTHLAAAAEDRRPAASYLQAGFALCDACVRRRDVPLPSSLADTPVCVACLREWEDATHNDFAARCRAAMVEVPDGFVPVEFVPPPGAVRIRDGTFVEDGGWRAVTATGAWTLEQHPSAFFDVLYAPWPGVTELLTRASAATFPLQAVVEAALASGRQGPSSCALDYLAAGFPVSPAIRALALRATKVFPEAVGDRYRRRLGP